MLRTFGYYVLMVVIWSAISLEPLLKGDADAFQATGSLIVAWGILSVGRERLRFEKYVRDANRNLVFSAINRLEAHRALNEKRLNVTFNMHMLQIVRLSRNAGVPSPHFEFPDAELENIREETDRQIRENSAGINLDEDNAFNQARETLQDTRERLEPWSHYVWYAELCFLVVGTLQWGYGAKFANWVLPVLGIAINP